MKMLLCCLVVVFLFCFPAIAEASDPHVVESGECLWTIAQRHDTTVAEIVKLNAITNPSLIHPGDVLILRSEYEYIDATDYALHQLGVPYVWGGNGYLG